MRCKCGGDLFESTEWIEQRDRKILIVSMKCKSCSKITPTKKFVLFKDSTNSKIWNTVTQNNIISIMGKGVSHEEEMVEEN